MPVSLQRREVYKILSVFFYNSTWKSGVNYSSHLLYKRMKQTSNLSKIMIKKQEKVLLLLLVTKLFLVCLLTYSVFQPLFPFGNLMILETISILVFLYWTYSDDTLLTPINCNWPCMWSVWQLQFFILLYYLKKKKKRWAERSSTQRSFTHRSSE